MDRIADIPVFIGFAFGGEGGGGGDAWIGLWGGLIGAFVGAAASGAVSYVLQKREHDRADKLRKADLDLRQRSVAHGLMVKLIDINSDLHRLDVHIRRQFESVEDPAKAWTTFIPLHQTRPAISYDRDESAILLDLGLNDEFNLAGPLPAIRNQLAALMKDYAVRRGQLWDMMPVDAFVEGGVEMDRGLYLQTERLRKEMADILSSMRDGAPKSYAIAQEAMIAVYNGLTKKLKFTFELSIEEEIGATPPG